MGEPALGLRFKVTIDGFIPLGIWTKMEGLSVEYRIQDYEEGGQNAYVHKIPGRAIYGNVRLTRPIDDTSALVAIWLSSVQLANIKQTACITVMNSAGEDVASWNLMGVWPAKWSGPSLDTFGNQLATETLELTHEGFLGLAGLAGALGGAIGGALSGSVSVGFSL